MRRHLKVSAAIYAALLTACGVRAHAACTTHWDVVSNVTSDADWGALQFDIAYSTGRFSGTDAGVRCTNLATGALYAPSDHDGTSPRILRQGWIANSPHAAPGPVSRCTFLSSDAVSTTDFAVTVTAHNNTAGSSIPLTVGLSVTCSLCGNGVLDAGEACDPAIAGQECCNADTCAAIVSGCNLCGNGILNSGEQCDDHETLGGDCCSSTCRFDASGAACGSAAQTSCDLADTCNGAGTCRTNVLPDGTRCAGDLCHGDSFCASGTCPNDGPPLCDDANPCTRNDCDLQSGACSYVVAPTDGCRDASGASLLLSTAHDGKAIWKWDHGQGTDCADFGAPDQDSVYEMCIFDAVGSGEYVLASDFHLPATAVWQIHDRDGQCSWTYRDRSMAMHGIKRLGLDSGPDGKAAIALSAQGAETPVPTPVSSERFLNFNPSVVVQLFNVSDSGQGMCWQSTFTDASKNDGKKFRAALK